jgi:hypothetical protein
MTPTVSDDLNNLIVAKLRDIQELLGIIASDVAGIKVRVTSLEIAVAGVNYRLDQVDERLKRRAGLPEGHET